MFLVGHSMGGLLALEMAGHARAAMLTAIDVSGVPVRYPAAMQAHMDDVLVRVAKDPQDEINAELPPERRRVLFYGPDGSFDPVLAMLVDDRNPVPMTERLDAFRAPQTRPALLERITIPTQWTIADDEGSDRRSGNADAHQRIDACLHSIDHCDTGWQRAQYQSSPRCTCISSSRVGVF